MATSNMYPKAVPSAAKVGDVHESSRRTISFDVTITPRDSFDMTDADEYLLTVNGRLVKRYTPEQAKRTGLIR